MKSHLGYVSCRRLETADTWSFGSDQLQMTELPAPHTAFDNRSQRVCPLGPRIRRAVAGTNRDRVGRVVRVAFMLLLVVGVFFVAGQVRLAGAESLMCVLIAMVPVHGRQLSRSPRRIR
jgi:hypothetical protein